MRAEILEYLQKFAHFASIVNERDFWNKFGEDLGQHLYRKFEDSDYNLTKFYNRLDLANARKFADLIDEVSAR
jgi:hypothetical protein